MEVLQSIIPMLDAFSTYKLARPHPNFISDFSYFFIISFIMGAFNFKIQTYKTNSLIKNVEHLLVHESFPVDIRHNAKIFREKLAAWAQPRVIKQ